ncbi:MAG: MATE family efflux transporter [Myxococcales bacterium]|nr:MATE family efflux transporter [Myxococcales bacterium]
METPGGAREVARIAWPLAVGMFSFTLMGVVDTLLMGHVSTTAQAGVAVATMVVITFIAFYRGVASGAQALVAAAHGARDPLRIRAAGTAAVLFALVLGVLATATIRLVAAPTLGWVVGDPDVAAAGRRYLEVRAFAVPMSMLSFGLLASIQGLGDTRTQMWVSLAGNVVNAVVGVLLVFGLGPFPRLEEAGAGWSTVAGAATMASLYALRFRSRIGKVLRPSREVITSVLTIGVPAGVQNLLGVSAFVVMNVALARAGQVELAASQVVFQIISLSFLPGAGIGEAGGVLLGRYLGAGQPEVAGRTLESARRIAIGVMSVFGLIFFFFGRPIASLFTEDPAVVERAAVLMYFAASFQVVDAVAMVHLAALRSAGDTRFTLLVTTISAWACQVPGTLVLGLYFGWGATGAWVGMTLQVFAEALITAPRVLRLGRGTLGRLDLLLGRAPA